MLILSLNEVFNKDILIYIFFNQSDRSLIEEHKFFFNLNESVKMIWVKISKNLMIMLILQIVGFDVVFYKCYFIKALFSTSVKIFLENPSRSVQKQPPEQFVFGNFPRRYRWQKSLFQENCQVNPQSSYFILKRLHHVFSSWKSY